MKDIAIKKIEVELAVFRGKDWEDVMKNEVAKALCLFCQQDDVFAKAVVDGGTFADCVRSISTTKCNGISDMEVYKRAVNFYFPGADIDFNMTINRSALVSGDKKPAGIILNLADFFS